MQWLSTKKRGRDDEQIELDRAKATAERKKNRPVKKKPADERPHTASSSDDDSLPTFLPASKKRSSKPVTKKLIVEQRKQRKASSVLDSSSDEEEDFLSESPFFNATREPKKTVKNEDAPTKSMTTTAELSKDDSDVEVVDVATPAAAKQAPSSPLFSPESPLYHRPKARRTILDEDEDDDDEPILARSTKLASTNNELLDSPCPDEEAAIALAIQRSREGMTIDLSLEDSEDEEDEVHVEDPHAIQAASVLETAKKLSTQVIQAMSTWFDGTESDNMGIIVDGALALSSTGINTNRHSWIAAEEMRRVCPSVKLADYQLIGVNWLALLHGMECKHNNKVTHVNGVLADEMGLGKTVQTIAFLCWLNQQRELNEVHRPHLIIAPASVLSNWEREFGKFAPDMSVVKYHGSQDERYVLQEDLRRRKFKVDVILVSITYFQKERSDDRAFLRKIEYDYMVVDEAHVLKNPKGLRYKSLDRFNTQHRLLLTGTPVQNAPKELLALLCFLMPLFSSRGSGEFGELLDHDGGESMLHHLVSAQGGDQAYEKLKQLFAPFVLRRRKKDVLGQILPPKHREVDFVDLDTTGREVYNKVLKDHLAAKEAGDHATREHLFTQLRKAAHHPLLLRSRHTSDEERAQLAHFFYRYGAFHGEGCNEAKVREEVDGFSDFEIHLTAHELIGENQHRAADLNRYILEESDMFSSAKCSRLRSILPLLIEEGHRVLIFSGWTSCLDLLACLLEHLGLSFLRMEGSTPVAERQSLIDRFESDTTIPVFLLSTKACGLGINLTAADTCVIHDLDFNPFNDLQAEDRCHRVGQTKPVKVIKLVSRDTVDEDIYEMQRRKISMNDAILEGGNSKKWSREAANEKENVLNVAVDRFLKSPTSHK